MFNHKSYYAWRQRSLSAREEREKYLTAQSQTIYREIRSAPVYADLSATQVREAMAYNPLR